jgi:hypothetical protein
MVHVSVSQPNWYMNRSSLVAHQQEMSKYLLVVMLSGQFLALLYYHWNYASQSDHMQYLYQKNRELLSQMQIMKIDLMHKEEIEKNCSIFYREASKNKINHKFIPQGVAATLLHDHPTWFQRRYTLLIQNTLNNLPPDWVIQIFYVNNPQFQAGMALSGGIRKLIEKNGVNGVQSEGSHSRIIFTELPIHVSNERKRPIHLMMHPWLWENMISDRVLIFGGNHVLCSNSPYRLTDFLRYDYISAPWGHYKGRGGGSGLSLRNRQVMLKMIERRLNQTSEEKRVKAYLEWGRDDEFFVGEMIKFNQDQGLEVLKLASKEVSHSTALVDHLYTDSRLTILPDDFSILSKWRDLVSELNTLPLLSV